MIKPYTPIFHVPAAELPHQDKGGLCALELSHVVSCPTEALAHLFQGQTRFLFHADIAAFPLSKEAIGKIASLVVSTQYYKRDNRIVFLASADISHEALSRLEVAIVAQGWKGCSYLSTRKDNTLGQTENVPEVNNNEVTNVISIFTDCLGNSGNYIYFTGKGSTAFADEERFYEHLEKRLSTDPLCHTVNYSYWKLKLEHQRCVGHLHSLKEQLGIAETFVALAKSKYKNDYDLLFEHYHTQYEVLPLWYKRFGHIVKVLTGKRTVRSLFRDEPKNLKA